MKPAARGRGSGYGAGPSYGYGRKRPRTRRSRSRSRSRDVKKRKRSRSRSESEPRRRYDKSSSKRGKKRKFSDRSEKTGEHEKKKKAKTGEIPVKPVSPQSFQEAWTGSFFLPKAILALTALGLSLVKIPILHTMCLGGRLKECVAQWEHIGVSKWVKNVLSFGYKIQLKFKPQQRKIPKIQQLQGQLMMFWNLKHLNF